MCWRSNDGRGAAAILVPALALSLAASCYRGGGGTTEECNGFDDDLDGVTDDPFIDGDGVYFTIEHCGGCGIDCAEVFPTAATVECLADGLAARCAITACPDGTHLVGESYCVADQPVPCLPCEDDGDCAEADPTAACLELPGGDLRCGAACDLQAVAACPAGFGCRPHGSGGQCEPLSGSCACTPEQAGAILGCWVESPADDLRCPGLQECDGLALGECASLQAEVCDGLDNDCNGQADEDFLVDGEYLADEHCGACHSPCLPPDASMSAVCVAGPSGPGCEYHCQPGFADIDQVLLNGCECQLFAASWPPGAFGVDGDCDGTIDPTDGYVFVAKTGDDANPGTLEAPVLTIGHGIALAAPAGRTVVVAQGDYDEQVVLAAGVSLFGGYRSDFGARDTYLFTVRLEHQSGPAGHPALVAQGIQAETRVGGFVIAATDGQPPDRGSTAVLVRVCGPGLVLEDLLVEAGAGANGSSGASSAQILAGLGVSSPSQLGGVSGGAGQGGVSAWSLDCSGVIRAGGAGGAKTCPVSQAAVGGGAGGNSTCPASGCTIGQPCGNGGCSDYMIGDTCDWEAVWAAAVPNPPATAGSGTSGGAAGEITYDAPTTIWGSSFCDDNPTLRRAGGSGQAGGKGASGNGGTGAAAVAAVLDTIVGLWSGGDGTAGTTGADGSGGGGGTQGNGYDALYGSSGSSDRLGGAGGGGGSGGCGAPGATGGGGGGGSIGVLIVLDGSPQGPTVQDVRVIPAKAGKGGAGGVGLPGGSSGPGGLGGSGNFWCARQGGKGGDGGAGGTGGGGGGGGGGSISGFHVVAPSLAAGPYLDGLAAENAVDPLPAAPGGGAGGYAPGASGTAGAGGTAVAFRLQVAPP
jgi:hypothetical protein